MACRDLTADKAPRVQGRSGEGSPIHLADKTGGVDCEREEEYVCVHYSFHRVKPQRNVGKVYGYRQDLEMPTRLITTMSQHIVSTCRTSYFFLRRISSVRHLLTQDTTQTLICSYGLPMLDDCNSLLAGCPKHPNDKFQSVQNSSARLIFKAPEKRSHSTPPSIHSLASYHCSYPVLNLNSLFQQLH